MAKKKQAQQKVKRPTQNKATDLTLQNRSLEEIIALRTGGASNIKGLNFQFLYAMRLILARLDENKHISIRLEGLEDIDFYEDNRREYIQTKSSVSSVDASKFWDWKVLQNFIEVFQQDQYANFRLAHNTTFKKGYLDLFSVNAESDKNHSFWSEKLRSIGYQIESNSFKSFLAQIIIEEIDENTLNKQIIELFFQKFEIGNGTEKIFFKALYYVVTQWSKHRQTINYRDLQMAFQAVKDSFSKHPINEAIKHNWVAPISFSIENGVSGDDYYEGKAARPIHIALGLPIRREMWASSIIDALRNTDIIVIRSSSGQGKSTLAWQAAFDYSKEDFKIYQLNSCTHWEQANAIADFFETRLKIGENPLLVIDGLSQSNEAWNQLATLLADKPVKLLLTTRQEDWFRYGADISQANMHFIDIKLTASEAENIYYELKQNRKLHAVQPSWQPAWEQVASKGLLIEYVYLLTSGQMISDRLSAQVKKLQEEKSGPAKMEMLRLISLADILNIRIKTSKLTAFITSTVRFESDRNEVYQQLEKEYYLKFDSEYIEGLHPVRSKQLFDLLHSHTPITESLEALLNLVDTESIYDFFISVPSLLNEENKSTFYNLAAEILSKKDFPNMVYAIDGLMHSEPTKYWSENRKIYDEIFQTGSVQLFVSDTIPFLNLNVIDGLASQMLDHPDAIVHFLKKKLQELTTYAFSQSDTSIFIAYLHESLSQRKNITNAEGAVFLSKWFKKADLHFPEVLDLNESKLLEAVEKKEIGEAADLFHLFNTNHPKKYMQFMSMHRHTIVGWIKRKTNSLSIKEEGNDIHIEYLYNDTDAGNLNKGSVYRINILHSFFPEYDHYCTAIRYLPFPNSEIFRASAQNAQKAIPRKNLHHLFDIHLNQIWTKTILQKYSAPSGYEWQQQYFLIRKKAIEIAKKCVRVFEYLLLGKWAIANKGLGNLTIIGNELINELHIAKKYPILNPKYFEEERFKEEEAAIESFFRPFTNFIRQMGGILAPEKEADRRLPVINLKDVGYRVIDMQKSFETVCLGTFSYFPFNDLHHDEQRWYGRLLLTIQFYIHHIETGSKESIVVPERSAEKWEEETQTLEARRLHEIVNTYANESKFTFFLPNKIIEEEDYIKSAVIGVRGCNVNDPEGNDLFELSMGLSLLSKTEIPFFYFAFVEDDDTIVSSFRFNRDYFEKFQVFKQTGIYDKNLSFPQPLPLEIPSPLLNSLPREFKVKKVSVSQIDKDYFQLLIKIWQLTQYRKELGSSPAEKLWLQEIEASYAQSILQNMEILSFKFTGPSKDDVRRFINQQHLFTTEEIMTFLKENLLSSANNNRV